MAEKIKSITDRNLFDKLLHEYFLNNPSYVKSNNGNIQVNNSTPLTQGSLPVIKRIAALIEKMGKEYALFDAVDEKKLVSDVSPKGLGIVFRDKKYIPLYREKSYVSLDMILPASKRVSMLTDVRHLEMLDNKIIKVGFEIKDMDNESLSNFENFLQSIGSAA